MDKVLLILFVFVVVSIHLYEKIIYYYFLESF